MKMQQVIAELTEKALGNLEYGFSYVGSDFEFGELHFQLAASLPEETYNCTWVTFEAYPTDPETFKLKMVDDRDPDVRREMNLSTWTKEFRTPLEMLEEAKRWIK